VGAAEALAPTEAPQDAQKLPPGTMGRPQKEQNRATTEGATTLPPHELDARHSGARHVSEREKRNGREVSGFGVLGAPDEDAATPSRRNSPWVLGLRAGSLRGGETV